jgi:hypothetical protein
MGKSIMEKTDFDLGSKNGKDPKEKKKKIFQVKKIAKSKVKLVRLSKI